jgi:hypothetical protein
MYDFGRHHEERSGVHDGHQHLHEPDVLERQLQHRYMQRRVGVHRVWRLGHLPADQPRLRVYAELDVA